MRKRINISIISLFLLQSVSFKFIAQNRTIDSLKKLLVKDQEDTNKVNHFNGLVAQYIELAPDSSIIFAKKAITLAEKIDYKKGESSGYHGVAYTHFVTGNYFEALRHWHKALALKELIKDKRGIAACLGNIGAVYFEQGNYPLTLEYYFKSLKIVEELNEKIKLSSLYSNIGLVYLEQKDFSKALKFYEKALKIEEESGDRHGEAKSLGNIGVLLWTQGNLLLHKDTIAAEKKYSQALPYFLRQSKIGLELDNKVIQASSFSSIGNAYKGKFLCKNYGRYKSADTLVSRALYFFQRAHTIASELGDKNSMAIDLCNIGIVNTTMKEYEKAAQNLLAALALANSIGALNQAMEIEMVLNNLYETTGNHKEALAHYRQYAAIKDSLFNEEKHNEITRHEMTYEFEKKEVAAKAEQEKKDAVTSAESKKQKSIIVLVCSVLALVFIFAGFIFRSLRITRKQKYIIEVKNKETELQKLEIEEKNKDILDSIHYAKRIQQSLLPTEKYLQRKMKQLREPG